MAEIFDYVLRDLPGIAKLEAWLPELEALPNKLWSKEADPFHEECDRVSRRLFGVTKAECAEYSREMCLADRDDPFEYLGNSPHYPRAERQLEAWGWDCSSVDGQVLRVLPLFALQIAAGADGLLPAARWPDDETSEAELDHLAAKLQAEAAQFQYRPKGR